MKTHKEITARLAGCSDEERASLVFEWVKTGVITKAQFQQILQAQKSEPGQDEIIRNCPEGKVPVFHVVSAWDEHVIGNLVYLKNGHLVLWMTGERVSKRFISEMKFQRYVDQGKL